MTRVRPGQVGVTSSRSTRGRFRWWLAPSAGVALTAACLAVAGLAAGCSVSRGSAARAPVTVTVTRSAGSGPAVTVTSAASASPVATSEPATSGGSALTASTQYLVRACGMPAPPPREDHARWVHWEENLRFAYFRTGDVLCLRGYYADPPPRDWFGWDLADYRTHGPDSGSRWKVEAAGMDGGSPTNFHAGINGDNSALAWFGWDQVVRRWRVYHREERGSE